MYLAEPCLALIFECDLDLLLTDVASFTFDSPCCPIQSAEWVA